MYRSILVPIDVLEPSSWQSVLPTVRKLAEDDATSEIHLVTVVPRDPTLEVIAQFVPEDAEKQLIKKAREKLDSLAQDHLVGIGKVQCHVVSGNVYVAILNLAESLRADIIVLASHRPELKDYLLGPVAARITRHAYCSVLVVRG